MANFRFHYSTVQVEAHRIWTCPICGELIAVKFIESRMQLFKQTFIIVDGVAVCKGECANAYEDLQKLYW
jgi:hypothetical protein